MLMVQQIGNANLYSVKEATKWVYEGVIDDPYGEFFIAENKLLQKVPVAENAKLTTVGSNHRYLECIKAAYDFASGELLNLIKKAEGFDADFPVGSVLLFISLFLLLSPARSGFNQFQSLHGVIEPNWHVLHNRLQTAKSIDEVIQYHDFFLDKCLRECLLLSPVLVKKLEKMKLICLQYAAAVQWLITYSTDTPKTDIPDVDKYKQLKLRTRTQTRKEVREGIAGELQSLGPILSSSSRAEPYLTHLAQWLLGVGRD
ncbi:Gamma-tubulin complex component 2 [Sesamum angolense]|uniref:Gamma-tubulin complex component n=1 Tax=Sesamum angolense TaxID=2727404 RepID=A0AAE1X1V8_9LAMI|nr:Gamma-tubulin complex component 2 [Sesamum angolense]